MTRPIDDDSTTTLLHTYDALRARQVLALLEGEGIVAHASGLNHRELVGAYGAYIEIAILVPTPDLERARELVALLDDPDPELLDPDSPAPEASEETKPPPRSRWSIKGFTVTFLVIFGLWRFAAFMEEGRDVRELFLTCDGAKAGSQRALDALASFARATGDETALAVARAIRDGESIPEGTGSVMSDAAWERWEDVKTAFRIEARVCGEPGRLRPVQVVP